MKVLIIGDHFATTSVNKLNESWVSELKKITGYRITNLSSPNISISAIYKKIFAQNLRNFNFVILILPRIDNLYHPLVDITPEIVKNFNDKNDPYFEIYEAADLYYKHIYDEELSEIYFSSILDEIIDIITYRTKLIIINTIDSHVKLNHYTDYTLPIVMNDITMHEYSGFSQDNTQFKKDHVTSEYYTNNMCDENRKIFAHYIKNMILTGKIDINLDNFVKLHDPGIYWKNLTTTEKNNIFAL